MDRLNVLDIYCGCGGFSQGLKQAGMNIVAGIDPRKIEINKWRIDAVKELQAKVREVLHDPIQSLLDHLEKELEKERSEDSCLEKRIKKLLG